MGRARAKMPLSWLFYLSWCHSLKVDAWQAHYEQAQGGTSSEAQTKTWQEQTLGHLVIEAASWRQPLAQIEPSGRRVFVFYPGGPLGPHAWSREWLIGEALFVSFSLFLALSGTRARARSRVHRRG